MFCYHRYLYFSYCHSPPHQIIPCPLEMIVCLIVQWCLTLCDPMDCSPPGSSVHANSPGEHTRVGCYTLLQGIFPTQGWKPGLLHCRWILHHLSHQGSQDMTRMLNLTLWSPKWSMIPWYIRWSGMWNKIL